MKLLFAMLSITMTLTSCLSPGDDESDVAPISDGEQTTATYPYPLYLLVKSSWDDQLDVETEIASCTVAPGTAPGIFSCSGNVNEGQLYFSKLKFIVGSNDKSLCPIVTYHPFYYKMSTGVEVDFCEGDDRFWSQTSPDSVDPAIGDCYRGPAIKLTNFPLVSSKVLLTNTVGEYRETVDSGASVIAGTNRWVVNDLADPTTAQAGYIANTMAGYAIVCRNSYFDEVYRINFTLSDNDGVTDHFSNWL